MNNALEELKNTYKPYRFTKKKNVMIIDSTSGSYVIKENSNNKVAEAYNYLISRNFDYFPKLAQENTREEVNVFEYIPEVTIPKEQKALDMMDIVALLHNKTTYYKEITEDKYKEIYDNIKNNLLYTEAYYDDLYTRLSEVIYPSPSEYLLIRNIYKIFAAIQYASNLLDNWYEASKGDLKERVAFIHNNLETDHYILSDKGYLVSWEKSKIDSPILDLITFYQKEYMNFDFTTLITKYLHNYPLKDNELNLFYLVISIPPIIKLEKSELECTKEMRKKLDYVFKTENFILKMTQTNAGDK